MTGMPTSDDLRGRPALSVVIPTYNDTPCLALTLRSLTRQTLATELFEVVVVNDGGQDPQDALEDCAKRLDLRLIQLPGRRGRAAARNAGLAEAAGRTVLFLDSDSYADPDLLRRHHTFHERTATPRVLLGKRYEIDWPQLRHLVRDEPVPAERLTDPAHGDLRFPDGADRARIALAMQTPWLYAHTNNASAPAGVLAEVGGFNEVFGTHWGWEDTELFYRVYQALGGADTAFGYDDGAACYHLPHYRDLATWQGEFIANRPLVKRLHPNLDWEFHGFRMPDVVAAKIRYYRTAARDCEAAGACRLAGPWDWVAPLLAGQRAERVLWIGTGSADVPLGERALTFDHGRPPSPTNFHLVGTAVPLPDGEADAVVSVDFWRCLPWADLCEFLRESTRLAPSALLVHTGTDVPHAQVSGAADLEYLTGVLGPYFTMTVSAGPGGATAVEVRRAVRR